MSDESPIQYPEVRGGGRVTVDADKVVELLNEIRREVNEKIDNLGRFLAAGLTTETPPPNRQRKAEKTSQVQPFELRGFDIDAVDWKTKDSSPTGRNEGWAWAFSTDVEGYVLPETSELVQACEQYGEVLVGPYLIKIGGRDKNLLNRRTLKK